jgi:uncharacterized protein with GYD domain
MPRYIRLTNLTQRGVEHVENSAERTERMATLAEELGGEIEDVFLTLGPYDFVSIARFPDDETYAEFTLRFAQEGEAETQTLKAIEETDYERIIASIKG